MNPIRHLFLTPSSSAESYTEKPHTHNHAFTCTHVYMFGMEQHIFYIFRTWVRCGKSGSHYIRCVSATKGRMLLNYIKSSFSKESRLHHTTEGVTIYSSRLFLLVALIFCVCICFCHRKQLPLFFH